MNFQSCADNIDIFFKIKKDVCIVSVKSRLERNGSSCKFTAMKADKLTSNHDISLVDKSLVDIRGDSVRQKKIRESEGVLVEKTCQFLNCRIGEKFFLDDIALAMGTNRSKLAACFKRVLSIGVFEWIRKQRMLKAKSLLLNSDMSIQIIGFEVGYENCANFSTTYKKYFGMSPRQQRK